MPNLSQIKRQRMLDFLNKLREEHKDDDSALIALGEIESELNAKKYGLVWEQHEEAVDVQMRTHIPVFTEDVDREITAVPGGAYNFLLEGDNLHSLRLLEKTHRGRIDVIYIDPPYNTKNKDFVYNDCTIGTDDGFRHSKWLSFMAERLHIAWGLLSDSGVIFISIDDNEQAQLKLLCDDIFGESAFVAHIPWRKRTAKSDVPFGISQDYESILCYANPLFRAAVKGKDRKYYETPDFPGKPWRFHDLTTQRTVEERPNSNYTMVNPKNGDKFPVNRLRCWAITIDTFQQYYDEDRIIFPGDYDFLNISKPVLRYWKEDDVKKAGADFGLVAATTYLPYDSVGMTQDGTKEITELFGTKIFSFPKPVGLIKHLIGIATTRNNNAIVLDFFAGSGTTAQAVLELNAEDGGNRKFILCTNNENGICENVTHPRIKTVISGKREDESKYSDGLPANLYYYRTDFVSKDEEYLSEALMEHIAEMIQLEHGVKLDGQNYIMILDDDEADALATHWDEYSAVKALYVSKNVLFTTEQNMMFRDVEIHIIPDYYFNFELREVGETW
ncbi:site-specific DNA-methyltransferase [Faecalicoccus pleomorphus]|uniref:site-specific DNA-methyltransferase n=1 Tax=Faecalicoccus pleomorphus TaxID=1323 RepID=UPI0026F0A6B4|nr:site-specific DNA-methyltransferase [Faecalicoccus pleomorphus]